MKNARLRIILSEMRGGDGARGGPPLAMGEESSKIAGKNPRNTKRRIYPFRTCK